MHLHCQSNLFQDFEVICFQYLTELLQMHEAGTTPTAQSQISEVKFHQNTKVKYHQQLHKKYKMATNTQQNNQPQDS